MQDLHGYYIEDLSVGMSATFAKTVTEADIVLFAGVSGDVNPVHINAEYAEQTQFKGRIAHGIMSVGFISACLANKLPGAGAIYLSQVAKFKAPVRIGDTVQARVTVKEMIPEKRRVTLTTNCYVGDTMVLEGEAVVMVDKRPA